MSVKVENTEKKNEVKLSFEVEAEKFDEAMKKVYAKTAKYFTIHGFRKGKAPMNMVEKQYGSEIFYEDTFNELVPEIYDNAIKENNIIAVSKPDIDITQIGKGKNLIFTAIVQTKPEVKLGKYKGIEIEKPVYTVSDEDVEHELHHIAEHNARLITIDNRPAEKGDLVIIDFEGSIDGVPFAGGKAEKQELEIGSNTFIPGFEDQVIGMKIDEERDINVTFPEDYFSKDLAGKPAVFKIKLHEIKQKELPELDDEFAKDVSEFDTMKEFKESIKKRMQEQNEQRAKTETENNAIQAVCDGVDLEIPSGMIETEVDNMIRDFSQRIQYQGLSFEQYCKASGKSETEIREDMKEQAEKTVKSRLVIEAIIKAENIEPDEKEVEEKLKEMAKSYGQNEEEALKNTYLKDYITENLKVEKAVNIIVENAKTKK